MIIKICYVLMKMVFSLKIPPPSVPRAAGHSPHATKAADPAEEPPVYLFASWGFLAVLVYVFFQVKSFR
jgi:hypothetical protein